MAAKTSNSWNRWILNYMTKKTQIGALSALVTLAIIIAYHLSLTSFVRNQDLSTVYFTTAKTSGRLKRVQQVCTSERDVVDLEGRVHGVFTHPSGVIYCFVAKAGCTFWKRMFNFALNEKSGEYHTPWDVPRSVVHRNELKKGERYNGRKHAQSKYPMRFIVTRNPFTRILSSYLDKFYLPDFWLIYGRKFSKKIFKLKSFKSPPDFMSRHFDRMKFDGNMTEREQYIRCGKRLTFAEFVQAILSHFDPHWVPVHQICDPCRFQPSLIVHLESFMDDSRVILNKMGLEHYMDGFSHEKQVDEEIQTIVDYNFHDLDRSKRLRKCVTPTELAYRLWNNFIWRGYIHPKVKYVIPRSHSIDDVLKDFLKQLHKARQKGLKNKSAMKKAVLKFRKDLYLSLDPSLMDALKSKFEMDFKFFGYNNSVENILHGS